MKHDPKATYFIHWTKLDDFLVELLQADTRFFKFSKKEMLRPDFRENWIKTLELPLHRQFRYFNFMDVLTLMCRY